MDDRWVGLIEIGFSFGLLLAFGVWQLHSLRRLRRAREAEESKVAERAARGDQPR